jgi:hypothetical protein
MAMKSATLNTGFMVGLLLVSVLGVELLKRGFMAVFIS